jgi:hypothetical protein
MLALIALMISIVKIIYVPAWHNFLLCAFEEETKSEKNSKVDNEVIPPPYCTKLHFNMGSILWLCDADQNIRSCTATRKSPF